MLAFLLQSIFELLKIVKALCFVHIHHRVQTVGPSDTGFNAFFLGGGGYIQSNVELRTHGSVDSIFRSTSARTHAAGFSHTIHANTQFSLRGPTSTPS